MPQYSRTVKYKKLRDEIAMDNEAHINPRSRDLEPYAERINTIAPGWIDTPMFHKATDNDPQRKANILRRIPMKTFGQPEDIGYAALYLSSPAGSYVDGVFLPVDAGASEAF